MPDLLPDDFGTETTLQPPLVILREQAEHLTRRTGGLIVAAVETYRNGTRIFQRFRLEVPTLDDYVYFLFNVQHGVLMYPAILESDLLTDQDFSRLESPEELEDALRTFFGLAEVRRVVSALKAQATAVKA
jgi:hypothetical protein